MRPFPRCFLIPSLCALFGVGSLSAATLTNLSVRTTLEAQQVLTVGLTTAGGSKSLVVRAVGPSLRSLGVSDAMADPALAVFNGASRIDGNDNWGGGPGLTKAFGDVGAFPLAATGSFDAALLATVDGGRTVQVSGPSAGNVLVEVYEAAPGAASRLTNLSALNRVGTGENILIAGLTISGTGRATLLIRAVGPSLAALGVSDVLRDPKLVVYDSKGAVVAENDNYDLVVGERFSSVGAFPLLANSRDGALMTTLPAGGYTVQVFGADGGTGTAIIEVYELKANVWERNGWTKPTLATTVATAATAAFADYVKTVRTPNQVLAFEIQPGAEPFWTEWITQGVTLIARSFSYPKFVSPYTAIAGVDRTWFVDTFTRLYGSATGVGQGRTWDTGSVAWGPTATVTTNSWSLGNIRQQNAVQTNFAGMAQTAGHEFFHIVQRYLAGRPSADYTRMDPPSSFPQWLWEGAATFIGHQTSNHLGFNSYTTSARPTMVMRANQRPTSTMRLEQVVSNTPPTVDPYGIGFIGTEFLVAQVGVEKFTTIYRGVGSGLSLPDAFAAATGVSLADFFEMFEDVRATLGTPRVN